MRLVLRFSLVAGGALGVVFVCAVVLLCGSERRLLLAQQDAGIERTLEAVAAYCAAGGGWKEEPACLPGPLWPGPETALRSAFYFDAQGRLLMSRGFSRGGLERAGQAARDWLFSLVSSRSGRWDVSGGPSGDTPMRIFSLHVVSGGKPAGFLVSAYDIAVLERSLDWLDWDRGLRLLQALLGGLGLGALLGVVLGGYGLRGYREEDSGREVLLSHVVHDLKNRANSVITQADVLLDGCKGRLNPAQAECARAVLRGGNAIVETVSNFRDAERLEEGRFPLRASPLEPESAIAAALDRVKGQAVEWGIGLEARVAPGLDGFSADAEAFQRVLGNLLSNSLKATPSGGRVAVDAAKGKAGELVVSVRDTGIGIPPERFGGLFEKFSHVPENRNKVRPSAGSGLGLYVSRRLVEAHGGRIWAEAAAQGACLRFALPAVTPRSGSLSRVPPGS